VFDPLGARQSWVFRNLPKYGSTYILNQTAVQSVTSTKCGEFCCYFGISRLLNSDLTFEDWINAHFSSDLVANENNVLTFLRNE